MADLPQAMAGADRRCLRFVRAGEMQSIYFLEREPQDVWRNYSIARTGKDANTLTAGHDASFINWAVAYYRYLAGIPSDKEPPRLPMKGMPCNISAVFPRINFD